VETGNVSEAPIDIATYRALEEAAGAEFVAELVGTFLDEAPRMSAQLDAALASGDQETFRRTAHSLKSNSMTFGALALGALARHLELRAGEVVTAGDGRALDALRAEHVRVALALAELKDA
jgi:HPt (histidine-containing phosphotransfer) domain-containing protein